MVMFHCYVSLPEGNLQKSFTCADGDEQIKEKGKAFAEPSGIRDFEHLLTTLWNLFLSAVQHGVAQLSQLCASGTPDRTRIQFATGREVWGFRLEKLIKLSAPAPAAES
jgi:hypothetical protein